MTANPTITFPKEVTTPFNSKIASCTLKKVLLEKKICQASPSSDKRTTNAFFDRMSKTETYATSTMKGKVNPIAIASPPRKMTTTAFFNRMSKTETFATSTMKGKVNPVVTASPPRKMTTTAFFERMSKTETFATSTMKGKINPNTTLPASPRKKTTNSFFDRMNKADTQASSMRKKISLKILQLHLKMRKKPKTLFLIE